MRMMKAKSNPQEVKSLLKQWSPGFVDYKSWVVVAVSDIFFYVHPENWGRFSFWLIFFKRGLVQPPTRKPNETTRVFYGKTPFNSIVNLRLPGGKNLVLLKSGSQNFSVFGPFNEAIPLFQCGPVVFDMKVGSLGSPNLFSWQIFGESSSLIPLYKAPLDLVGVLDCI